MATKKPHPFAEMDIRILERKLRKGEVTREQFEEMLASLPESGDYSEIDETKLVTHARVKDDPAS